jgi:predicted glycoside hydrolase/deacetylase ChbG (UPF0249 family)
VTGLLIVNADDWGHRREVTDAILRCHRVGAITATTAMVHMEDTERAAALAGEARLPTGLHLNLTRPYTSRGAPSNVRERQARLAEHFAPRWRRFAYEPQVGRLVADCVRDQLEAFQCTYGIAPDHVDGHHHIQAVPTVFFSPGLAGVRRLRPAHTFVRGERRMVNRLAHGALNAMIRRRFDTPHRFISLRDLHPDLGGRGVIVGLADAATTSVEVMVHPGRNDEQAVLLRRDWAMALARYRTGSYEHLK